MLLTSSHHRRVHCSSTVDDSELFFEECLEEAEDTVDRQLREKMGDKLALMGQVSDLCSSNH